MKSATVARYVIKKTGKILKLQLTDKGYLDAQFKRDGKLYRVRVHKLVYEAFSGAKVPEGMEIDHRNTIKTDNMFTNLEAVTRQENVRRANQKGLRKKKTVYFGKVNAQRAKQLLAQGMTCQQVATTLDTNLDQIRRIKQGVCYAQVQI